MADKKAEEAVPVDDDEERKLDEEGDPGEAKHKAAKEHSAGGKGD
jgi:hypothetical protein